jgi:hypothetical protein
MKRVTLFVSVAATFAVMLSGSAHATVLIEQPQRTVKCGVDLKFGYWYQAYSGGSRRITLPGPLGA